MGDVVRFNGVTTQDHQASQVLDAALENELEYCVVIGYGKEGDFYFASSKSDGAEVLWLLKMAEHKLMGLMNG